MADSSTPLPSSATNPNNTVPEHAADEDLSSQPNSPPLSRSHSTASSSGQTQDTDDWDFFPPLDKLTVFDYLDQLALPQRLEKINRTYLVQRDKVKRGFESTRVKARLRTDQELEKYREKYSKGLDKILENWNDTKIVSSREKLSFVVGVSNIFITGLLIGGYPEWMHVWYSLQLLYFMPIRYYTYHQMGYHYFLADLCYFVNVMLVLAIWVFPNSRRLMISAYCLSYGNNAWAIAMWRNSMVFHSLDKVTSLFIHIMPPVVLHCLVHLVDPVYCAERFPAISRIKHVELYGLWEMIIWATVPYAIWQLSYHVFITVRRREKIAAGRPTSFTWLKKSYKKTWIGKIVLGLPSAMQEPAFMFVQYSYAVVTMLPCPLWFYNRKLSAIFIAFVGLMSVYNGATYYIDVFGKRFQKELEQLRKDAAKWQNSPPPSERELDRSYRGGGAGVCGPAV
ncbi:hypothetical protein BZA05DRAFT_426577 [Tricharina praecox]|uniref:uncharacterized protein n=1 Tax=Tricharina praecox TaxID=43433 RepID=UPI00221EA603|nr:uncharacterized protein BZA05DRAFT_426577 [Tricharina praecox]KAI5847510.1 hypothetical protein BZA05DRAFT_426577 [Tricharina praecox]